MSNTDDKFNDPYDFEKVIKLLLERQNGCQVIKPPANTKGYDLEAIKDNTHIAVQVKNHKAKIAVAQINRFINFLELPIASKFQKGIFVSASGFAKSALTYVNSEEEKLKQKLRLYQYSQGKLVKIFPIDSEPVDLPINPGPPEKTHIGVFTCKGGVGKTTISAHLAGAFALMGYDVLLIDLDPEGNLKKLLSDGVFVPAVMKGQVGTTITVINLDEWEPEKYSEKVIIYDCSPVFESNPRDIIEKFNYGIIPTTLNPLGINKHGDVIIRTFKSIRKNNQQAELFALINNFHPSEKLRNKLLNELLKAKIAEYSETDKKCKYIDPEHAAIRYSLQLLYWGDFILTNGQSRLAFNDVGGRCFPRTDFLNLAGYLEAHTDIEEDAKRELANTQ